MQIEARGQAPRPFPRFPVVAARADRGAGPEPSQQAAGVHWPAVARLGSLRLGPGAFSIWLQLRGEARVQAREGQFVLAAGEWLALERDSAPELVAGRHGITLGMVLPIAPGGHRCELLPGRGRMAAHDLRIALRLWRDGRDASAGRDDAAARALCAMLRHLATQQRDLDRGIERCPGRSMRRKRQVFGRLQCARLFLEGHRHRVVRLTELAELTSFSSWYLSKTFHGLYNESPQAASVRLRLERACELLARTDDAIGEIGAACGFDNSCSFARAFRARFRTTASAWREASRRDPMPGRAQGRGPEGRPRPAGAAGASVG